MESLLRRFNFTEPKGNYQIYACVAILWLVVVVCTLSSLRKQKWTRRQRIFWIIMVTGLPFLGVLCYLPFSFRLEDYPFLKILRSNQN